jgi:hypothetical protein
MVAPGFLFWLADANSATAQGTVGEPKLPEAVDTVLCWLPEDTQTAIVAQGPYKPNAFDPERKIDPGGNQLSLEQSGCGPHRAQVLGKSQ